MRNFAGPPTGALLVAVYRYVIGIGSSVLLFFGLAVLIIRTPCCLAATIGTSPLQMEQQLALTSIEDFDRNDFDPKNFTAAQALLTERHRRIRWATTANTIHSKSTTGRPDILDHPGSSVIGRRQASTPALPCNLLFVNGRHLHVGGSTVGGVMRRIANHHAIHGVFTDAATATTNQLTVGPGGGCDVCMYHIHALQQHLVMRLSLIHI